MKRETYEAKLALTVVTDEDTVGYAKEAAKIERQLISYWKTATKKWLRENGDLDLDDLGYGEYAKFPDLNAKITGSVVVEI